MDGVDEGGWVHVVKDQDSMEWKFLAPLQRLRLIWMMVVVVVRFNPVGR